MTQVPNEVCELKPIKICVDEVVSLPSLELVNECVDVPKEVCSVEKVNPRQVARPIVKLWCNNSSPGDFNNLKLTSINRFDDWSFSWLTLTLKYQQTIIKFHQKVTCK